MFRQNGALRLGTEFNNGGRIVGGTIANARLLGFASNFNNVLDGVTLAGSDGLNIGTGPSSLGATGTVRIANGITFAPGAVFNVVGVSNLLFDTSFTFNNATVNLGSQFGRGSLELYFAESGVAKTLTLGANLNVQGRLASIGRPFSLSEPATLVNNAVLIANEGDTSGSFGTRGDWRVGGDTLVNNGVLRAEGPNNTINVIARTIPTLGTMEAVGTNASNQRAVLSFRSDDVYTQSVFNNVRVRNGGQLNFGATLDNRGTTFDVASVSGVNFANGLLVLGSGDNGSISTQRGGQIVGGTIANACQLFFSDDTGNLLDGVTLAGSDGLNVGTGNVRIRNGINFAPGAVFNVGGLGDLYFDTSFTFDNALVNLGDNTSSFLDGALGFGNIGGQPTTLTLGANLNVQGKLATVGEDLFDTPGVALTTLVNNTAGGLLSDEGGSWSVTADTLINNSRIEARGGSSSSLRTNSGTLQNNGVIGAFGGARVTLNTVTAPTLGSIQSVGAGSLVSFASDDTYAPGTVVAGFSVAGGGTLNLGAVIGNQNATFDVASIVGAAGQNGALRLGTDRLSASNTLDGAGRILGGTIANAGLLNYSDNSDNVLSGVTLAGGQGLNVRQGGVIRIFNGISFAPGAVFNVDPNSYLLFDDEAVFDNARVNLGSSAASTSAGALGHGLASTGSELALTLGANLDVQGRNANFGEVLLSGPTILRNNAALVSDESGAWNVRADNVANTNLMAARGANSTLNIGDAFNVVTSFTNTGTVQAQNGGVVRATAVSFNNAGAITVGAGSQMVVAGQAGGESLTQTAGGLIDVDGTLTVADAAVENTAPLRLAGGVLSGDGTLIADIENTGGTVSPEAAGGGEGSMGSLLLDIGVYTQSAGGALRIDLGGASVGQFDLFDVDGPVNLGGRLELNFVNGFTPAVGNVFRFFEYGANARTGEFASVVGLNNSFAYTVSYQSDFALLAVAAIPEPGTLALLAGLLPLAAGGALRARRRRR